MSACRPGASTSAPALAPTETRPSAKAVDPGTRTVTAIVIGSIAVPAKPGPSSTFAAMKCQASRHRARATAKPPASSAAPRAIGTRTPKRSISIPTDGRRDTCADHSDADSRRERSPRPAVRRGERIQEDAHGVDAAAEDDELDREPGHKERQRSGDTGGGSLRPRLSGAAPAQAPRGARRQSLPRDIHVPARVVMTAVIPARCAPEIGSVSASAETDSLWRGWHQAAYRSVCRRPFGILRVGVSRQ